MRALSLMILLVCVPLFQIEAVAGAETSKESQERKVFRKEFYKLSDFTPAQREKLMEDARAVCKKKYGAPSTVYRFDYSKLTVTCTEPGR